MEKKLREIAKDEIILLRDTYDKLLKEEIRIKERLSEISKIISKIDIHHDCFDSYIAECSSNPYTCPVCFVRGNGSFQVKPIPSNDENDDVCKCPNCGIIYRS